MLIKFLCWIGWHRYYVKDSFNSGCRQLGCRFCNNLWGMHDETKTLIKWNRELQEFHYGQINRA